MIDTQPKPVLADTGRKLLDQQWTASTDSPGLMQLALLALIASELTQLRQELARSLPKRKKGK